MMRAGLAVLAALVLGMALPARADPPSLTTDGLGALRIGMSEEEARAAIGALDPDPANTDNARCYLLHPSAQPGLTLMIERGKLSRLTLGAGSELKTDKGIALGAPEGDVYAAYSGVRSDGGFIDNGDPWQDLYVEPQGRGGRGLRFVVDKRGKISAIHAGGPSIEYREDCG